MNSDDVFDLFVIGGGINGCGIARDAAGRGLSVALAEKSDLGSGTSSGSTKLIHGGLRYLEHYEFGLVRKSLVEREVLWKVAPHIIYPLRFILPHHKDLRPSWLIRLGLFLYDHLGGRKLLPPTRVIDFTKPGSDWPLNSGFKKGFEYSDCWVDDARLVVLNAQDAAGNSAKIMTRTPVESIQRDDGVWHVKVRNPNGSTASYKAKAVVNASGPWIDMVREKCSGASGIGKIRMVRGSHVVVPSLFDHPECYIFQNADGRIVFAIPYEEEFTLVGTTDADYEGDPSEVSISKDEKQYLCDSLNSYFKKQISPLDIVWTYSAVRPLLDEGNTQAQTATRDYRIDIEPDRSALINVYGGKITTYRKLAEDVLKEVGKFLTDLGQPWTENSSLPGGDFSVQSYQDLVEDLEKDYQFLASAHARRLIRQYGTYARRILNDASSYDDLGICFGSDLYEAEVIYLVNFEWAISAEDILWRRTKRGLKLTNRQAQVLDDYLREKSFESQYCGEKQIRCENH